MNEKLEPILKEILIELKGIKELLAYDSRLKELKNQASIIRRKGFKVVEGKIK